MNVNEGQESANRDELIQRVALMEAMIAEGRQATARYAWAFVMWGVIYLAATGWAIYLPHPNLAWPVCVAVGMGTGFAVKSRRKKEGGRDNLRSRSVGAVWAMMGAGVSLYAFSGAAAHRANSPEYVAAILFFIGLAHGTSAMILRWGVQAAVAALWWASGIAILFVPSAGLAIFLGDSFFGMIVFGLYAMSLERRRAARLEGAHQ